MRTIALLVILICVPHLGYSSTIDSLENALEKEAVDSLRVNILNELADAYKYSDFEKTYSLASHADSISKSINYKCGSAKALKYIGVSYWNKGNYALAKDFFYKSLKIYEEIEDIDGIGRLWNNIGLIDITQDDFDTAINNFKKSISFCEQADNYSMIGSAMHNIGIAFYHKKRHDSSLTYQRYAMDYYHKANDSIGLGRAMCFAGMELTSLKRYDSAYDNLEKSYLLFDKQNNERGKAMAGAMLSQYFIETKQFKKAVQYALEAYSIALSLDYKVSIYESSNFLSKAYAGLSSYKKAYKYKNIASKYLDSLKDEENKSKIAMLTAEYNYEKKMRKLEEERQDAEYLAEKEIYKRGVMIYSITAGLLLAVIGIVFLSYVNRKKKRTNEILNSQNEKIESQKKSLEALNEELQALNATKDKFFSIIAHDLKNPVFNFKSLSDMLMADYKIMDDNERIEFVGLLSNSAGHMYALLDNLLTWSRTQRDAINYDPFRNHIDEFLKTTINVIKMSAESKDIQIKTDIQENSFVFADFNMLNTIVRNLLSNSLKYTQRNGKISLIAYNEGNKATIIIKDSGVGIPKEKIPTLFAVGKNRSTDGTEDEKGTGLGLIIVKEFVDKSSGEISVESIVGEGTTFTITLPANKIEAV